MMRTLPAVAVLAGAALTSACTPTACTCSGGILNSPLLRLTGTPGAPMLASPLAPSDLVESAGMMYVPSGTTAGTSSDVPVPLPRTMPPPA